MGSCLSIEIRDHVAWLRFERAEVLNALNVELAQSLEQACTQLANDPQVRVLVLHGSGKAFMAGGDLAALRATPADTVHALIPPVHRAVALLADMPKPVIAAVHGAAAGAGMSLALGADFTLLAEGTRLSFAYSDIATSCDGGMSWSLPRLVGLRRATEIAMLGDVIDAAQALELGLVNRVVEREQLLQQAESLAQRLAQRDTHALGQLKQLLRTSSRHSLEQQLEAEYTSFLGCATRPEFSSAIDSFFAQRGAQKRPEASR